MSRQPLNIVVLGGSYAGLSVAHHFLDNIIHQLSSFEGAPTYRVVLISPSTHLYWNICAPRALVSPNLVDLKDAFVPIEPAFSRHPFNEFEFMQGWAIEIDTSARKVKIELVKNKSTKRISGISKASSSTAPPEFPTVPIAAEYRSNTGDRHVRIQTIPFHAIIVATGTSAHSPLYTLHGTHEETLAEIQAFHRKLESAHSVVIVGGGPSGVETAGQIATYYNRRKRWKECENLRPTSVTDSQALSRAHRVLFPSSSKRNSNISSGRVTAPRERELERRKRDSAISAQSAATPPTIQVTAPDSTAPRMSKTITLLSGGSRLLPKLPRTVSKKAEKRLRELGVHVVHKLRELGHTTNEGGSSTDCHLNSDMTITSDLLISATGVYPNTRFFSNTMLDGSGYVITDRETLRVYGQGIGGRVYAIGDCASYSRNCLTDVYDAIPVLMKNLHNDLLAHEYRLQTITAVPDINTLAETVSGPAPHVGFGEGEGERWEYEPLSKTKTSPGHEQSGPANGEERGRKRARSASPTLPLSAFSPQPASASPMEGKLKPRLSFPAPPLPPPLLKSANAKAKTPDNVPRAQNTLRAPLLTPMQSRLKIAALEDAKFVPNQKDTQLMPITRFGGTGTVRGWRVPGFVVWMLKGWDYGVGRAKEVVEGRTGRRRLWREEQGEGRLWLARRGKGGG